ncbi:NAD(P)-dependent oxidoreductase [Bullifex porci]|uniref:NAD(P)-dependent oxidoreductase n=1 Tax=Bullifex porci TaxID=2606638 RepID=UPI0023F2F472|nr:NAD(P)-dependent oxidoreductase [Bullifex porci]MDD7587979.1 NAD(P)-dependent oxidoreductase [Bullifex porci]
MAYHVLDEADKCLGCKKPMCQEGCPIHTNIPEAIRLLKQSKLNEAGKMLFENNPLTTVCAIVCNHERQCEGHCIRNKMKTHDPVHFSVIEDYISTTYANKMTMGPAPKNGRRVAIVGSGPAGLTISVLLARWGYDITIFEARDKIGGVMRYGIPSFRLPDRILDDFQYRHLELKDIKVRTHTTIGRTLTIDDLFRDGYDAVFIGAGLRKPSAMHIKGESLGNVVFAIDYLGNSKAFKLGDNVAVVGVGNSAMDCARTAIRNGASHVTCYSLSDDKHIQASVYEYSYASIEGVNFRFNKKPVEIREKGMICLDTVTAEDGSITVIEGSEKLYPHTGVIVAIGQLAESTLVKTTQGIDTTNKGLLSVDSDGKTTRAGVFAGGDAVNGARTVVEAVATAKNVAVAMDEYMKSLPPKSEEDPYKDIPVYDEPIRDAFSEQFLGPLEDK